MKARALVTVLSALLSAGCFSTLGAPATGDLPKVAALQMAAPRETTTTPLYRIQSGDRLDIRSLYRDELEGEVTVGPDGQISVGGLGQFQAVGLTTAELSAEIVRRASITHRNPSVTVRVKEFTSYHAYVGGEVKKPGFVVVTPGMTTLRAVWERGGFAYSARTDSVLHIAWNPQGGYSAQRLDLSRVLETGDTTQDLALGPNDMVYVPATWITNADLWVRQWIIELIPVREPTTRITDF